MFKYFKESFRRKKARRITQEYPPVIHQYDLKQFGKVDFANWTNPLVPPAPLTEAMASFFKKFIKEGDFVIDIGSNIGDTTVPMALCAGPTGLTLAVEPNPLIFKILEKNATLNQGRINIVPVPFAISKEEGEFFYTSSEASFANGGISDKLNKFVYPQKVKGINLEKFLDANYSDRLNRLSFIKIDAEGYDKEIIKSIPNLLAKYKPVIVAESINSASKEEKMELYDVIAQNGYDVYYFEDFFINAEIVKLTENTDMLKWKKTFNIYGVSSQ